MYSRITSPQFHSDNYLYESYLKMLQNNTLKFHHLIETFLIKNRISIVNQYTRP